MHENPVDYGIKLKIRDDLPEKWNVVKLEEVADLIMGQSPPGDTYNIIGNGMPFLQGKAEFTDFSPNHIKYTIKPLKIASKGSVLLSVRAPVGDVNFANIDYCIGRGLASISLINGNNIFLLFLIKFFKSGLEIESTGSTFKAINKSKLQNFLIPFPPFHEQQRIAAVLSAVQEAKEKTEEVIKAARELKKSLMHHLFTYGAVPVGDVGDVADISTGTTPSTKNRSYYNGRHPFIRTTEISNNIITKASICITDQAVEDYHLKLYPPGTVFIAMYGQGKTRGQVALIKIKAATTQNTGAIVTHSCIEPKFLWFYLISQYYNLRKAGIQGHISHLNLGYVKLFLIPLPPLPEQHCIAEILSTIDKKIETEENKKNAQNSLFKTLIDNLMTAKIRVNNLNIKS